MESQTDIRPDPVLLTPLSEATIEPVRELYERGLYVQACRLAESIRPLRHWRGIDAQLLAARIAENLGGEKLGAMLRFRAWRADRRHPEAIYYYARLLFRSSHPLRAWQFMREQGELAGAPPREQADWLSLVAVMYGRIRDFDSAHEWMAKAEKLEPDNAWIRLQRGRILELEDQYGDALESAQSALKIRP